MVLLSFSEEHEKDREWNFNFNSKLEEGRHNKLEN